MLVFVKLFVCVVADLFRPRVALEAEVARLRHEVAVLRRNAPRRIALTNGDRMFLVLLHRLWPEIASRTSLVAPATLLRWHRQGFRTYWRWKSRALPGRPKIPRDLIELIKRMAKENPLWGAPRIHGELLMLEFDVAQSTVSKSMPRRFGPPSQTWKTFLENHAPRIAAIDMCVVPAVDFTLFYVLIVLHHDRRKLVSFAVTRSPTAEWLANRLTEAFPWDYQRSF